MTFSIFLVLIGFVILIKGAGVLVEGSASIAKKHGLSNIFIGLTIVAFGTSAPELIVNIMASVKGTADIAIGNVIGSNISNILLILGLTASIYPLVIQKGTTWKEIPFALLSVVAIFFLAADKFFIGFGGESYISRADSGILILFFIIFMYYTFGISKVEGKDRIRITTFSSLKSYLMVIGGIICLFIGGKWVVDGSVDIASKLGISQALIGLTIVAIGTSLPELVTSITAASKKHADMAVGNIVGSNIFNILWILGVSGLIRPLPFNDALSQDIGVNFIANLLLFITMFIGHRHKLQRWQGMVFVLLYILYIVYIIFRG